MTEGQQRFDNGLERCWKRLSVALSITLFAVVAAQAQQPSTKDTTKQSTPVTPIPSQSTGSRRIQAVRISDAIKIDGLLDEAGWSLTQFCCARLSHQCETALHLQTQQRFLCHLQPKHRCGP